MVSGCFWDGFGMVLGSVRDRLVCVWACFAHVLAWFWYSFNIVLGGIFEGGLIAYCLLGARIAPIALCPDRVLPRYLFS